MGKIKDRDLYKPDTIITGREFWALTNEDGKTVTIDIFSLGSFYNGGGGIQNPNGYFTWVVYAQDDQGLGMTNDPTAETLHIGLAYNKESNIESTDPEDYIWGLIDGINSWTDDDDVIHYTWIKYADTPTTGMAELPFGKTYIGLSFDHDTYVETDVYGDYHWSSMKGMSFASNQNNRVVVIDIPEDEMISTDEIGIAEWVNTNGLDVGEDEIVLFNILLEDVVPEIPVLDYSKSLDLSVSNVANTTATLSWNRNNDTAIDRYVLIYTDVTTNLTKSLNFIDDDVNTVLQNLADGNDFSAYIIAYDTSNNEKKSNTVTFTTLEIFVPSTPNLRNTAVTDSTVTMAWDIDVAFGADRYVLFIEGLNVYDGPDLSHTQTGLEENTNYDCYVIAYNGVNPSNQSSTVTVKTLETIDPPLTQPIISIAGTTTSTISVLVEMPVLEWDRIVSGGDSKIFYRPIGAGTWNEISYNKSLPANIITGLPSNSTFDVKAQLSDGNIVSPESLIINATTLPLITANINLNLFIFAEDTLTGNMVITGGQPGERIMIDMEIVYDGENPNYVSTLSLRKDSNDFTVTATPGNPESARKISIPATLDANGEYSFMTDTNNTLLITAWLLEDINYADDFVTGKFKIIYRDQGDLSGIVFSMDYMPNFN